MQSEEVWVTCDVNLNFGVDTNMSGTANFESFTKTWRRWARFAPPTLVGERAA
jgi:hypothetical protein